MSTGSLEAKTKGRGTLEYLDQHIHGISNLHDLEGLFLLSQ